MSEKTENPNKNGDFTPVIVIDTREQAPLPFCRLKSVPGTLTSGDYSFAGAEDLFSIERKSIADLVACCTDGNRERFERELHRLRGYRFKRLLIVGARAEIEQHRYRSQISPNSVLASIQAFEVRYDTPVVWATTPEEAAEKIESWAHWYAREILKAASLLKPGSMGIPADLTQR